MKQIEFEMGELVQLGSILFGDVVCEHKMPFGVAESYIENQLVMYIEKKFIKKLNEIQHKVLYCNKFYFITDNSYAINEESKRNLQKVSL